MATSFMPTITDLRGPAGFLEAMLDEPAPEHAGPLRAAVVFAHPHPQFGGTMHTKAVYQGTKGLTRIGCAVLRFNFRGVGRSDGTFAQGEGEKHDFTAALDYMAMTYPTSRLWAAGFSFGSWVALEVGASDDRVSALIGIAPPVVTSVSGLEYSFPHTLASTKDKFFVQGEEDEVCSLAGLRAFYARLEEPKDLVVIDAANHLFEGQATEVGEALEELLGDV
ncbi:MAG: alpha/beta fold hydrolase [Vicinamibacterales bacterium]